jgi:hypothetical protein
MIDSPIKKKLSHYGDPWCDLPSIEEIINFLKISQSTFYRAIAKLTEFG